MMYGPEGQTVRVNSAEEQAALGKGWSTKPLPEPVTEPAPEVAVEAPVEAPKESKKQKLSDRIKKLVE